MMDKYKISKTVYSSASRGAVAETERNGGRGGGSGSRWRSRRWRGGKVEEKGDDSPMCARWRRGLGMEERRCAHRQRLRARRRWADGGRNGGTLGRAAGVARWSSRTGPRQARLKHRPTGQRGRLREVKAQRRSTWLSSGGEVAWRKGSVARSDRSLLKRKEWRGGGSRRGRSAERGSGGLAVDKARDRRRRAVSGGRARGVRTGKNRGGREATDRWGPVTVLAIQIKSNRSKTIQTNLNSNQTRSNFILSKLDLHKL
jgi:hypothetical protein